MTHRFDEALEYFLNLKKHGLTVIDYNCTWYIQAKKVDVELDILDSIINTQKHQLAMAIDALDDILKYHFYGIHAEKYKQILLKLREHDMTR